MKYEIETTNIFDKWLAGIVDIRYRARIIGRFDQIQLGNFGDHKSLGHGLFELRFFFGPGFRAYYTIKAGGLSFCYAAETRPAREGILRKREIS